MKALDANDARRSRATDTEEAQNRPAGVGPQRLRQRTDDIGRVAAARLQVETTQ